MFEYLIQIEPRLYDRYLTVERNIKSASNSFYDSYLDMQEQFVKTVIMAAGIDFKPNETCGALLKKPDVVALFSDTLGCFAQFRARASIITRRKREKSCWLRKITMEGFLKMGAN